MSTFRDGTVWQERYMPILCHVQSCKPHSVLEPVYAVCIPTINRFDEFCERRGLEVVASPEFKELFCAPDVERERSPRTVISTRDLNVKSADDAEVVSQLEPHPELPGAFRLTRSQCWTMFERHVREQRFLFHPQSVNVIPLTLPEMGDGYPYVALFQMKSHIWCLDVKLASGREWVWGTRFLTRSTLQLAR